MFPVHQCWYNPIFRAGAGSPVADLSESKEHPAKRPVKWFKCAYATASGIYCTWTVRLWCFEANWKVVSKAECLEACANELLLCQVVHAVGLLCSVLGGVLSLQEERQTTFILSWAVKRAEVYHIQVACFYIHKYTFACRRRMKRCKCSCVWKSILWTSQCSCWKEINLFLADMDWQIWQELIELQDPVIAHHVPR